MSTTIFSKYKNVQGNNMYLHPHKTKREMEDGQTGRGLEVK